MCKLIALIMAFSMVFSGCKNNKPEQKASADLDQIFANLASSGMRTNDTLETIKEEQPQVLLDYLMTCFLSGELALCQWNDGSEAYLKFAAWDSMLAGESMPLETQTPLEYWMQWRDLAERSCSGEGCRQQWHVASHRYLALIKGMDDLFADLASSGEKTNEELERLLREEPDLLLSYLMERFMEGALETCQLDDGSVETLQFTVWCSQLGMEGIEAPVLSPQQYWDDWSSYAMRIYELNGMNFLIEQNHAMNILYAKLLMSQGADIV